MMRRLLHSTLPAMTSLQPVLARLNSQCRGNKNMHRKSIRSRPCSNPSHSPSPTIWFATATLLLLQAPSRSHATCDSGAARRKRLKASSKQNAMLLRQQQQQPQQPQQPQQHHRPPPARLWLQTVTRRALTATTRWYGLKPSHSSLCPCKQQQGWRRWRPSETAP